MWDGASRYPGISIESDFQKMHYSHTLFRTQLIWFRLYFDSLSSIIHVFPFFASQDIVSKLQGHQLRNSSASFPFLDIEILHQGTDKGNVVPQMCLKKRKNDPETTQRHIFNTDVHRVTLLWHIYTCKHTVALNTCIQRKRRTQPHIIWD